MVITFYYGGCMRIAIVDLGSNSFRLLLGQKSKDSRVSEINIWKNEPKRLWTTRLGNRDVSGNLTNESMQCGIDALKEIQKEIAAFQPDKVIGIGTSALREAKNSSLFIEKAIEICPMELHVISGEEEGRLGFMGATQDVLQSGLHYGVLDVGGGSTEVSLGSKEGVYWTTSYLAGAVRFKEISQEGPQHVWEETVRMWDPLPLQGPFGDMIAVGGTATSLAAIHLSLDVYDSKRIQGHRLTREAIEGMILQLRYMSCEERAKVPGLQPERADIIVAGAEIITSFMDTHEIGSIVVSDTDGMEGAELVYGAHP